MNRRRYQVYQATAYKSPNLFHSIVASAPFSVCHCRGAIPWLVDAEILLRENYM